MKTRVLPNRPRVAEITNVSPGYKQARDDEGKIFNFVNGSMNGLGPEFTVGTKVRLELKITGSLRVWKATRISQGEEVGQ